MGQSVLNEKVDAYKLGVGHMNETLPNVVEAYNAFTAACFADGQLSRKHKQLVALGIALLANNEVCTVYHATEAVAAGAAPQEVLEAVAVAAAVGGGHSMSQGVTRVQQVLEKQFPVQ